MQEQGFLFSSSTSTPMAQVPMPIDDWTQDATISAEYFNKTPWGRNWNAMLKYGVSLYTDAFNSFTAENPFGGPGNLQRRRNVVSDHQDDLRPELLRRRRDGHRAG